MAKTGFKERVRFLVTIIHHGNLSDVQQGVHWMLMVLKASFQSSSLSSCPAGLLQN